MRSPYYMRTEQWGTIKIPARYRPEMTDEGLTLVLGKARYMARDVLKDRGGRACLVWNDGKRDHSEALVRVD